ncbi:MAG: hypothetical protein JO159_17680 [Acidobacteria bacterium]|nr:hypothetical protein [Acidobacteriota bacterium]
MLEENPGDPVPGDEHEPGDPTRKEIPAGVDKEIHRRVPPDSRSIERTASQFPKPMRVSTEAAAKAGAKDTVMPPAKPTGSAPDRRRKIYLYVGFLFALVIAVEPEMRELLDKATLSVPPPFYSYRARIKEPNVYQLAIVTLTPGIEPDIFSDVCRMREFLAKTIVRVQQANPGLIVILRSFLPSAL